MGREKHLLRFIVTTQTVQLLHHHVMGFVQEEKALSSMSLSKEAGIRRKEEEIWFG